jgi:hypothetical protein
MSRDTVFVVWPNCLLALPTDLATDLRSMSGLLMERGTETPSTFFWRVRDRIKSPPATPATPAAVAPTATAGPLALLATCFTVPTTPFELSLWLCGARLCALRFAVEAPDRLELDPLLERREPLPADRGFAPAELARARLFDPEAFEDPLLLLEVEPLADLLFVCLLPDDLLFAATAHPSSSWTLLVERFSTHQTRC